MMRGTGSDVLYLDFDGVLHHEDVRWHTNVGPYYASTVPEHYKLFQHVALLEKLLKPYPDVCIVLSTSWVVRYGMARAGKNLSPALRCRVIGATFHSRMDREEFLSKPRGQQVTEDVLRRVPARWLALDDDPRGWACWTVDHYIRTNEHEGISDPAVLRVLTTRLREVFGAKRGEQI
jgi:hypothetical protein